MENAFTKYVIGNKDKTKFLGWDDYSFKLIVVSTLQDEELELMSESCVDKILETNKNTRFYFLNDMLYKYKVVFTLQ